MEKNIMADKQISELEFLATPNILDPNDVIAVDTIREGGTPLSRQANLELMIENYMIKVFDLRFPIGSVIKSCNPANPVTYGYVGTWVAQASETSSNSVAIGDGRLGTITGTNTPAVPLLAHIHTSPAHNHTSANHTHANTVSDNISATQAAHTHTSHSNPIVTVSSGGGNTGCKSISTVNTGSAQPAITINGGVSIANVGQASIIDNKVATIDSTGEASPTLNVQGKVLHQVFWLRTE
jgi:hypothetical protein